MKTDNLERSEQAPNENGAEGSPSSSDKVEVAAAVNNQAQAVAVVDGDDSESCVPFEEDGEVGKEDLSLNDADSKPKLGHQENLQQKASSLVSAFDSILSKTERLDEDTLKKAEQILQEMADNSEENEELVKELVKEALTKVVQLLQEMAHNSVVEEALKEVVQLLQEMDDNSEEEKELVEEAFKKVKQLLQEMDDNSEEEEDLAEDEDEDSEEEEELDEDTLKKAEQILQEMDDAEDPQVEEEDDEDPQLEEDDDEDLMEDSDEKNGRAGPGRGYTKEMLGIKPNATNPDSSESDDSSDEEEAQPPKKITKKN